MSTKPVTGQVYQNERGERVEVVKITARRLHITGAYAGETTQMNLVTFRALLIARSMRLVEGSN